MTNTTDIRHFIAVAAREDNRIAIYGIGHAAEEAIADAVAGYSNSSLAEDYVAEPCTKRLYDRVEQRGGCGLSWHRTDDGLQDLAEDDIEGSDISWDALADAYEDADTNEARDEAFRAIVEAVAADPDLPDDADCESGAQVFLDRRGIAMGPVIEADEPAPTVKLSYSVFADSQLQGVVEATNPADAVREAVKNYGEATSVFENYFIDTRINPEYNPYDVYEGEHEEVPEDRDFWRFDVRVEY